MESILSKLVTEKQESLSIFSDPFKKDNVDSVFFHIYKDLFDRSKIVHSATVEFKSGNTKGKQIITADGLQPLIKKTEDFIQSLA